MTILLILRAVFLLVVLTGLIINVIELLKAVAIRRRLVRAKVNGLRHQAAGNLLTSAKYRLVVSALLAVLVGVLLAAPPPRPESRPVAILARGAFIGLAWAVTQAGVAARRARTETEALIEATDGA